MTALKCKECGKAIAQLFNLQKDSRFLELTLVCQCGAYNTWDDIFNKPEGFD